MKLKHVFAGLAATIALTGVAVAQSEGMGPGMMGGDGGGYGMGSGTMGGNEYGMRPGMMFGYTNEAYSGLDLTPEQKKSIASIHKQASKGMWQHMGTVHGQGYHMQGLFGSGPLDEPAARKSFNSMIEAQTAMFELQLGARKQIDAILTQDQRDKLRRHWGSR
jgi:Spy/CpxP family protein refolding chaperone